MIIHNVQEALVHYATDNTDSCPKSLNELVAQKYLNKEPKDDYGQPLMYVCPATHGTRRRRRLVQGQGQAGRHRRRHHVLGAVTSRGAAGRHTRRARRGFSLIEIMVVIAIVGLHAGRVLVWLSLDRQERAA